MTRLVAFTHRARADVSDIEDWLLQPGAGPTAIRRLERLRAAISGLADLPCAWPRSPGTSARQLVCQDYRVVYRLSPDTGDNQTAGDVLILRVFGPGQQR